MKVLTANRLRDGAVVYFTAAHQWSVHLADAKLLEDEIAVKEAETLGQKDVEKRLVVALYTFEVEKADGVIKALSMRERIRADHAPTIIYDQGSWQGRMG